MNKVLLFISWTFVKMLHQILLSKVNPAFVFLKVKRKVMGGDLYPHLLTYKDSFCKFGFTFYGPSQIF